jgi:hypothetical protein
LQQLHFLSQDRTDICIRDGPSLQKELLVCVYYTGVLSHSQLLFWYFCFEEMAMEGHQMANVGRDQDYGSYKKITD